MFKRPAALPIQQACAAVSLAVELDAAVANRRKETKGLSTNQVKELNSAWHHAARTGRPLNTLITVRPLDIDDLTPTKRCQVFAAFRNKLSGYARNRNFPPTYAWSREINSEGTGEHMHILMHIPPSIGRTSMIL